MCKCVRDADRLDSLKPHYTKNDIGPEISVTKATVDLQCTRFKTRIRRSGHQVRPILHHHPAPHLIDLLACPVDYSTSVSKPTKANLKVM